MSVVSVELALVRAGLPDLSLRPGTTLAARIADRQGAHGVLVLAGVPLVAQLPPGLEAGARLRLAVQDANADRLVLRVVEQFAPAQAQVAPPPPAAALPLPDDGRATVHVTERDVRGGGQDEHASVSLRYESPALGAIDLRLSVAPGLVAAAVQAAAGHAHGAAATSATDLRESLEAATGRRADVTVSERHDPFEAYA